MELQEASRDGVFGLDLETGKAVDPQDIGVYDNVCVKKHMLDAWWVTWFYNDSTKLWQRFIF